ncbi:MAG TPA: hypothetical protein VEV17_13850 [Bryobacteraceae bacterium]|nr:hypothetical protein [Bryobacteraceae bacterium]
MAALHAVTEAKTLLDEAQGWWPWTWASIQNQRRVRSAIEDATAALDREVAKAQNSWRKDLTRAYQGGNVDPSTNRAAKALREAEAEFNTATALAKKTFDEAEKEWNAAKARDGALEAKAAIQKHEAFLSMARAARG